jgi:carbonic anhydrase
MRFPLRALAAASLSITLLGASSVGLGAEMAQVKTSPRKVPLEGTELVDPMDKLREKLAAKLGANATAGVNPNVLQVTSRAGAGASSSSVARMTDGGAAGRGGGSSASGSRGANGSGNKSAAKIPWSYEGAAGPDKWGQLKPEFSQCTHGTRQSPIDIRDGISVQMDPVQFDYKSSSFGVIDTGRTVQVNVAPGNAIEVMGRKYELVRFDFQRPSEERIDGRQFDMGVHLVHKDAQGRTAIVAVLLDRGAEQPVIQSVWNNLPLEQGEELTAKAGIDLTQLLPSDRRYFTYMGSMTTPPCKEGVLWMVMKSPVAISSEQLAVFSRLYKMNARPIQSASGRLIKGP